MSYIFFLGKIRLRKVWEKKFSKVYNRNRHGKIHDKESYKCSISTKTFNRHTSLKRHEKVHENHEKLTDQTDHAASHTP